MNITIEIGTLSLKATRDSQLIANHIAKEYQAKDSQLIKYLIMVRESSNYFKFFKVIYVLREQNSRPYLLSMLTSTTKPCQNRIVIKETLVAPSIDIN